MNKTQKEVLQSQLNTEKKTINELKQVYTQALKDCETKIRELSSRTDMENLQSIIYQKQYQEALKGQLEGVLANLQSNSFATVSEYLTKCYQEGYTGTMYDLMKQGIPLIMPIDQEAVVKAIQTDSKISTSLYTKMGEDIKHLKNSIRAELSMGIANGSTWNEMAAKMAIGFKNTPFSKAYNNTIRIARTEGHRVSIQSAMDAQHKAKEKGADVVKQWDASLDGRTRLTHRQLDGQIREIDDDFEVGGRKVSAPGMFGDPAEDCNCRCALLQRAIWALDEEELNTLKQRAEYFGLDKSKDFDDFKGKYLKISDEDIKGVNSAIKSFVPANTIGEAEEYARNNFVKKKTWSGDGNVSYKGLSLESANKINEILTNLYSQYDIIPLNNIQPMNFRANIWKGSENIPMAYRPLSNGELYFNPKIMKNPKMIESYIEEGKKAYKICEENIDKFTGSNRQLVEIYLKAGRQLVAESTVDPMKAIIEHEMGHHIENTIIYKNKELLKVVIDGYEEYGVKVSGYATKTYGEYIAESFAAFSNDQSDIIEPKLKSIFEKMYTKEGVASLIKNDNIESIKTGTSTLKTIYLPKQEYAHVISEINTHMSDEQRNKPVVSKAIGDYIYTFENHGFNNYRIIGKVSIDKEKYDEIEKLFN